MYPFITEGPRLPVLFIGIGMLLSMWKNVLFTEEKFLFSFKSNIPLIFKVDIKQLGFGIKVMFSGADSKAPLDNFTIFMESYNNLFFLAFDFLFNFLETNYTQVCIFTFMLLGYFVSLSYYVKLKFNKRHTSLYELLIFGLFHTKLLFITATFIYSINKLYEYITPLFQNFFFLNRSPYPLSNFLNYAYEFLNSEVGKLIIIVIIAHLLSLIITLAVVKTNKTTFKLVLSFVISSLLLRSVLLWLISLIPGEFHVATIGIELLTARFILFDFFKTQFIDCFFEKLNICYKTILNWSVSPVLCNETNGEWKTHFLNRDLHLRANNMEGELTNIARSSKTEVLKMMEGKEVKHRLLNKLLTRNEINCLEFVYQKSWLFEDRIAFIRRAEDNAILPMQFIYLLPDFSDIRTQPQNFVPFPFSTVKFTIPLFEYHNFKYFDLLLQTTINNTWDDLKGRVILSSVKYMSAEHGDYSQEYYSFFNVKKNIKPAVVQDWYNQDVVFIEMSDDSHIKYNPYYITDAMLGKPIVIKLSEGVYAPANADVNKLYKPNEVGLSNSLYRSPWTTAKSYMDRNPTVTITDAIRVAYSIQTSSILRQINFEQVDWS